MSDEERLGLPHRARLASINDPRVIHVYSHAPKDVIIMGALAYVLPEYRLAQHECVKEV